jgi:hypothetical protein
MEKRMKNKYIFRSRISEKKFREIVKLFCLDTRANKTAEITGIHRTTINRLFDGIRRRIFENYKSNPHNYSYAHYYERERNLRNVHRHKHDLFTEECRFRYEHENDIEKMYQYLLKIIRENPLVFSKEGMSFTDNLA